MNTSFITRLPSEELSDLDDLAQGRTRNELVRRIIRIAKSMGPEKVWPEDKAVKEALDKLGAKARRAS